MPKWNCSGTAIVHLTLAYLARGSTGMSFFMCHHCELPFGVAGPWNPIRHRVCGGVWASGGGHRGLRLSTGSVDWGVSKRRGVVSTRASVCGCGCISICVVCVSVFWGCFFHTRQTGNTPQACWWRGLREKKKSAWQQNYVWLYLEIIF